MDLEAAVVEKGQRAGDIHSGDPHAPAHLYSVLVNRFLTVGETEAGAGGLSTAEVHDILDRVMRRA